MSSALGTDVPFFVKGVPARARGIGERLTPLRRVPRLWLIILYPNFPVLTAEVYRNLPLKLTKAIVNTSINFSLGVLRTSESYSSTILKRLPWAGILASDYSRKS